MKNLFILLIIFFTGYSYAQKSAYIIYNSKGKKVSYKKMIKEIAKKDILLFGELHNNPISHWLQYEVTADLNEQKKLILGAEMIEADNQLVLDQYLSDSITYEALDTLARLWPNYTTDYAPLVDFAKENQLPFVASNIPRKYASLVYKKGFEALDTLPLEIKQFIAPLPIPFDSELKTYKNILLMMGKHGSPRLVQAQAIKDATMAHFILKNYMTNHLFIHYNGAYHSDHYEGILWYLKGKKPNLNYTTITTVLQKDVHRLKKENLNTADYIICVDDNMTTTY